MLEPNSDLEAIFERAVKLAIKNKHEYITLEHFLYSLIIDTKFEQVLGDFGADLKSLKENLEQFIAEDLQDIVVDELDTRPRKTQSMERKTQNTRLPQSVPSSQNDQFVGFAR